MNEILNKMLLLLFSFLPLLFYPANVWFVGAFFVALSLSALCYILENKRLTFVSSLIYGLIGFAVPEFFFFTPLLSYDIYRYRLYPIGILYTAGIFSSVLSLDSRLVFLLLTGTLFGCLLSHISGAYENLNNEYHLMRDDSTERNILLKEKNRNLLEQQDAEIYTATLKERNRIAREIHDNVGHLLSRSILVTAAIKAMNQEEAIELPLSQLEETLSSAMTSIRSSVHDLHDESINLKEVVSGLVKDFTFCPVTFSYDCGYQLPREVKYCFIAIIKEGLTNISRHSNATRVHLSLVEHPGFFQLTLHDNGTTFSARENSGIGLTNMRDRVETLNGYIKITHDDGFRIFVTLPKEDM